jgi:hypothetical protein
MDDQIISMSKKEIKKYDIIKKVINQELNGTQASELLGVTTRQIRRIKRKAEEFGIEGLTHAGRGQPGNRRIPEEEKKKIKRLLHERYFDFGPLFASEKLEEVHGIARDKGTIRSIMIEEGLWKSKPGKKQKEKHRSWRQRRSSYGEMAQYDGSYHHWFEDRSAEKCCLLAVIDDAQNRVWAKFDHHEGVKPTFSFWREYIDKHGKPYSIYVDKFSTYSMNHKLALENPDTLTQFERAMETLNIEIIHAHSPEAKGRVENLFKTLQDRLIKELRLNNISTIEEANRFLEEDFLPRFNAKFMVEPKMKADLHKELTKQEENKLDSIFSRQYKRTVRNDFTFSYKTNWYQLTEDQAVTICKGDKITVEERMDGAIHFSLRGKYLNYEVLPERPKKINEKKKNTPWVIPAGKTNKPSSDHPWRKSIQLEYLKKVNKSSK